MPNTVSLIFVAMAEGIRSALFGTEAEGSVPLDEATDVREDVSERDRRQRWRKVKAVWRIVRHGFVL